MDREKNHINQSNDELIKYRKQTSNMECFMVYNLLFSKYENYDTKLY